MRTWAVEFIFVENITTCTQNLMLEKSLTFIKVLDSFLLSQTTQNVQSLILYAIFQNLMGFYYHHCCECGSGHIHRVFKMTQTRSVHSRVSMLMVAM